MRSKRGECTKKERCDRGHVLRGAEPCAACTKEQAAVKEGLAASGAPLESNARQKFESRFGFDFQNVRVHDHPKAAAAVDASAFTVGRDIVLGDEARGARRERLLAHELAHVVQQRGVPANGGGLGRAAPGDAREHEAEMASRTVVAGGAARVAERTGRAVLQRAPKEEATAPAEPAKTESDEFPGCNDEKKRVLKEASETARSWVINAHKATRDVKAGTATPDVTKLFAGQFRFAPGEKDTDEYMNTVESSYARMEQGANAKVSYVCENERGGQAAQVSTGLFSCAGKVSVYDNFFDAPESIGDKPTPEEISDDKDLKAHILVHELAHKFAGREGEVRPDYTPTAYGCERQWPRFHDMGAKDAVQNADSYALFARHVSKKK